MNRERPGKPGGRTFRVFLSGYAFRFCQIPRLVMMPGKEFLAGSYAAGRRSFWPDLTLREEGTPGLILRCGKYEFLAGVDETRVRNPVSVEFIDFRPAAAVAEL